MTDLFKTLSSGLWKFLYAWVLPALITTVSFTYFVFPDIAHLPVAQALIDLTEVDAVGTLVVISIATLTLTTLMGLTGRLLYRLLEGYVAWPAWLFNLRREAHVRKWRDVTTTARRTASADTYIKWQLAAERLSLYPTKEQYILPTLLGNATKAMETYGETRYGLDSQIFWYDLQSVASSALLTEEDDARAAVDFFISGLYSSLLFASSTVVVALTTAQMPNLPALIIALGLVPFFYYRSVDAVADWRSCVEALVNTGRPKLAKAVGLRLPETTDEERDMWALFASHVFWSDSTSARALDKYRVSSDCTDEPEGHATG